MFDNPIILIIAVAAGILRWLWQRSQEEKQNSERPTTPGEPIPPSGETKTEEERIRRFLEALGQPTTSTPPPKVAPKPETQRRTFLPQPTLNRLPPLTTVPPPLPAPMPAIPTATMEGPAPHPIRPRIFQRAIAKEAVFEVHDLGVESLEDLSREGRRATARQRDLIPDLTSLRGLRSAVVLREIFGPPRGLQAFDATTSPL